MRAAGLDRFRDRARLDRLVVERELPARSPGRCAAAARRAARRRSCCRSPGWCIARRRSRWRGCLPSGFSSRTPQSSTRLRISSPSSAPRSPKLDFSQPKIYSATPPENVTSSILPRNARGSRRNRPVSPSFGAPPRIASNRRSAMAAASARACVSPSTSPSSSASPRSDAKRRPASSRRTIFPSASVQTSRAPTSSRRDRDHLALGADRDLGGAAADVDVHHRRVVADRARHRARAVGRHHGLQAVAGADRDELAGLPGKQLADGARIAPAHRDAGEDQRAGVDLVGIDLGVLVLLGDEGAERVGVDRLLGRIGREQDVGLIEGLALGDDVAAVEPLQHDAREHEMRGRRADVDADAENADLVLVVERAAGRWKRRCGRRRPVRWICGI